MPSDLTALVAELDETCRKRLDAVKPERHKDVWIEIRALSQLALCEAVKSDPNATDAAGIELAETHAALLKGARGALEIAVNRQSKLVTVRALDIVRLLDALE